MPEKVIDIKYVCSKCGSEKIVNPYNNPSVEFRCLECDRLVPPINYIGNGPELIPDPISNPDSDHNGLWIRKI